MASAIGWYGPLIDLSKAASHLGDFVQLLVFVHRSTPVQYKLSRGGEIIRTDIQVGDDTKPFFCVSIWQKQMGSMAVAGDIILLQNVKITKFQDVIEAKTVQCSSLLCLVHPYESLISKGIDDLVGDLLLGVATKEKLRKVIGWVHKAGSTFHKFERNCYQNELPKNWKVPGNAISRDCLSLAEVSQIKGSCRANFYASIGEIFLPISWKPGGKLENEKMFISRRLSKVENDKLVEDLICTGCQLCGSPLDSGHGSTVEKATVPLYCERSSNRLHIVGHIYRPFMLYVWDDLDYIPLHVTNKAAELLFGSITAEKVYSCLRGKQCNQNRCSKDVGTNSGDRISNIPRACEDLVGRSCPTVADKSQAQKGKDGSKTMNLYLIWLILLKMLLKHGKNSPLKFEVTVNPCLDKENGRFELISLSMPCCTTS